ncbi:MAG: peptidoglycan-binding protein [Clostridia bacterium]|nr:peptidoglycan-binding protein [Clostridia bacterium]
MQTSVDHTDRANNIRELQRYLRGLSYHDARIPSIPITGIRGEETNAALRAFLQREGFLEKTSIPDTEPIRMTPQYWNALRDAHAKEAERYAPAAPLFPITPAALETRIYPPGFYTLLQLMLSVLARPLGQFPAPTLSGTADAATTSAIAAVQALAGQTPTGIPDLAFWREVSALYNLEMHKFSASPPMKSGRAT